MQINDFEEKTDSVAKLIDKLPVSKRIGAFKGKFEVVGDFDESNEEIAEMLKDGCR